MAEFGYIVLIIAFILAVYTAAASIAGKKFGSKRLLRSARTGILAVSALFTLALALVLYAFFSKDFSLTIVAEHSSRDLPALYALSALYADKAGSIFFWGWLISLFTALLVFPQRNRRHTAIPYSTAILAVIIAFYLALTVFAANIFAREPSPLPDGFGLNPLLQNFGMLLHPPLLYLGFAGFAIVFALVIASLIERRPHIWQDTLIRRWAIFAWVVLGIGNIVGMWWSYNELGWGGYWAWDPVENAGLMPWLLGTALLHSMAMSRLKDNLKTWAAGLAVFTYIFTLLSPFITHGGIESPLHGFYGSHFPPFILGAIAIAIIGSLVLIYNRRDELKNGEGPASLISREGSFLLTDIVITVLVLIILIGTVLPSIVEMAGGPTLVLERGFFDRTAGPVLLLLVVLMGICPLFGWGRSVWKSPQRNITIFLLAAAVISAVIVITGVGNWYILPVVSGGLGLFVILREWWRGTAARRRSRGLGSLRAFFSLISGNRARYGGFLAHIGIILLTVGIIASSFYGTEKTVTLDIGESVVAGDYELTYSGLIFKQDYEKVSAIAELDLSRNDSPVGIMRPSYDYWFSQDDFFAEVAVRTTAAEDLFVSMVWTGFDPADRSATFRVLVNPMIVWMWVGGAFFVLGGALSFSAGDRGLPGGTA